MSGAFQTSRDIFQNPIWKNIVEFRLFFLIYGNAVFSDGGVRLADDLILKRGEWCRSTRKLQEDLTYIENRQVKTYSTSVINRCIKKLVESHRICTRMHELGTVFTVVNYEQYQGLFNYKNQNLEQNLEHSGNSVGTVAEQSGNNNKNVNKDKKVNKDLKEYPENAIVLTTYLIDLMKQNNPNAKVPTNLDKWYDEMDKLQRIDKYDYMQVQSAIYWCQNDNFWKGNILSVPKLRAKMDTLIVQMQRKPQVIQGGQARKESAFERMQRIAEEEKRYGAVGSH